LALAELTAPMKAFGVHKSTAKRHKTKTPTAISKWPTPVVGGGGLVAVVALVVVDDGVVGVVALVVVADVVVVALGVVVFDPQPPFAAVTATELLITRLLTTPQVPVGTQKYTGGSPPKLKTLLQISQPLE